MRDTLIVILGVVLFLVGRYFYFKPSQGAGDVAPNIEGKLVDGSAFNLRDLEGEFVLLDFWGSWCGPCRRENPKLVELWTKVQEKNLPLKIVSVGIETNEQNWKNAIRADQLNWPYHISSIQRFSDPIAKEYGVRQIPTTFLLSRKQEIIAVNPQIDRLIEDYLSE